jgi:hypothetical protein
VKRPRLFEQGFNRLLGARVQQQQQHQLGMQQCAGFLADDANDFRLDPFAGLEFLPSSRILGQSCCFSASVAFCPATVFVCSSIHALLVKKGHSVPVHLCGTPGFQGVDILSALTGKT